mmetsp:Transcript_9904/g.31390  ORF Transcript_9904/g.31390 Transcript_9904/m.31390 type:complete len:242 (+) Transcript_9904:1001-1726(+)
MATARSTAGVSEAERAACAAAAASSAASTSASAAATSAAAASTFARRRLDLHRGRGAGCGGLLGEVGRSRRPRQARIDQLFVWFPERAHHSAGDEDCAGDQRAYALAAECRRALQQRRRELRHGAADQRPKDERAVEGDTHQPKGARPLVLAGRVSKVRAEEGDLKAGSGDDAGGEHHRVGGGEAEQQAARRRHQQRHEDDVPPAERVGERAEQRREDRLAHPGGGLEDAVGGAGVAHLAH